MDPLTAFATAGTVIQFVDFTIKILSTTCRLTKQHGQNPEFDELKDVAKNLTQFVVKLRRPLRSTGQVASPLSEDQKALDGLCTQSDNIANDLLKRIKSVEGGVGKGAWKNFKVALKATWAKKDLESLLERLSQIKDSIELRVLAGLRDGVDLIAIQQSDRFDRLDVATQNIVCALLDFRDSKPRDINDQTNAIAEMLSQTEIVIEREHDNTRSVIISAIEQAVFEIMKRGQFSIPEYTQVVSTQNKEKELREKASRALLKMLYFPGMSDRREEVSEAHRRTFRWILHDGSPSSMPQPQHGFKNWLSEGNGLYWINGKAGSGKSTMMKYIYGSETTHRLLKSWSKRTKLCTAAHFFWNSGSTEQKSQTGLLRSLLHQIMSQSPGLIPIAFPGHWARIYSAISAPDGYVPHFEILLSDLKRGFASLVTQVTVPVKICLFVDGLDEYEGDHSFIVDLFAEAASSMKICLSSRPWLVFEDGFGSFPNLRLQELTHHDIANYTEDTLHTSQRYRQLQSRDPYMANALSDEIVSKADGVFLWVILAVKSLLDGLQNRDDISDLLKRTRLLPRDLDDLFTHMLSRIDPFYRDKTSKVFQIVRAANRKPITVTSLFFAMYDDLEKAIQDPIVPAKMSELERLGQLMTDRLDVYSAGLLEVSGVDNCNLYSTKSLLVNGKVQHFHRTVRDYLEQSNVWSSLLEDAPAPTFLPDAALLRSCILQMKSASIAALNDPVWYKVFDAMTYAAQLDRESVSDHIELLDELDRTMAAHVLKLHFSHNGKHWFSYYPFEDDLFSEWENDFAVLAIKYELCVYIEAKLTADPNIVSQKAGRPLLDYVVGSAGNQNDRSSTSHKIVEVLLKYGARPETKFKGTTSWENVLITVNTLNLERHVLNNQYFIIKSFLEHGADPRAICLTKTGPRPAMFILEDCFATWFPPIAAEIKSMLVELSPVGGDGLEPPKGLFIPSVLPRDCEIRPSKRLIRST